MSGVWGRKVRYTIFGESHGRGIGIILDGLPPGLELDLAAVQFELARRAPGRSELTTTRREADEFSIVSGWWNGKTTGSPLCAVIENTDARSADYEVLARTFRPGHADYSGYVKYGGHNDPRGGGHFSGRLTAPLVFAGAVVKQILRQHDVMIGAQIQQIGSVAGKRFDPVAVDAAQLKELSRQAFPTLDQAVTDKMRQCILAAKQAGDSVGGVIELAAVNLPAGRGEPFFDSVESTLAHLLFSIPAVKGVEFGAGFAIAAMRGSAANDVMYIKNGTVNTSTNHNGGVLGGITNGMPLVCRVAVKPTPSIQIEQPTVNSAGENVTLNTGGRHDACIVPRAVPVVEAVAAMAVWEAF